MVASFIEVADFIKVVSCIMAASSTMAARLQLVMTLIVTKQLQFVQLEWVNHSKASA